MEGTGAAAGPSASSVSMGEGVGAGAGAGVVAPPSSGKSSDAEGAVTLLEGSLPFRPAARPAGAVLAAEALAGAVLAAGALAGAFRVFFFLFRVAVPAGAAPAAPGGGGMRLVPPAAVGWA